MDRNEALDTLAAHLAGERFKSMHDQMGGIGAARVALRLYYQAIAAITHEDPRQLEEAILREAAERIAA